MVYWNPFDRWDVGDYVSLGTGRYLIEDKSPQGNGDVLYLVSGYGAEIAYGWVSCRFAAAVGDSYKMPVLPEELSPLGEVEI